jgi:hypothetical protein
MSRFQAQTNVLLDQELEELRRRLGLERSQKAELLSEVAALASWVVRQAESGRTIEARRGSDVEPLVRPSIERLRARRKSATSMARVALTHAEVERLADILDRDFTPSPALRRALEHLADPKRRPPKLRWKKRAA